MEPDPSQIEPDTLGLSAQQLERELARTREELQAMQALLEDLPSVFENKFRQRLQPLLEQYQLSGAEGGANALLKPMSRDALPPEVLAALQLGLTEGIHNAFYVMAIAAAAGLVAVLWFPRTLGAPVESTRASNDFARSDADATPAR